MSSNLITKFFGTKHERDEKKLLPIIEEINRYYSEYQEISEEALKAKTDEFKTRLAEDETIEDLLPEAFAVVKEVCRRHFGKCSVRPVWNQENIRRLLWPHRIFSM